MCEPISISMGIAAASMLASNMATSASAKKAQKNEDTNFILQSQAQNLKGDQENQRAQEEKSKRAKDSMIERGKATAMWADTGLSGISYDKVMQESQFNQGFDMASMEANRSARQTQIGYESKKLLADSKNRRNNIRKPDWIGGGLSIATAGAGAYAAGLPK